MEWGTLSCFSLLGSFRIKPRLSCILVGDLHAVGVIGLSLPKAQHMLLPITLIGISSADSTGQMYIIHNHFNANMQGWERKYVTKKESAISVLFLFSSSFAVSLLPPHLPAYVYMYLCNHCLFWRIWFIFYGGSRYCWLKVFRCKILMLLFS